MADPQADMQNEAAELQMWQKVAQLAQSGDPQALGEIGQIAQQAIEAQQKEMQGMAAGGQGAPRPSLVDRLRERQAQLKSQQAGAPQGAPQPGAAQ